MNHFNLFMAMMLSVSMMACEVDPNDGDDAGMGGEGGEAGMGGEGGEGGMGGEGGGVVPEDVELRWVLIFDSSEGDSGSGTAGADICGLQAMCDGMSLTGVSTSYLPGEGDICSAEGPGCMADRGDPMAALDDGTACEAASAPSDYISLGLSGLLGVDFGRDLRGCTVTVREFEGADPESVDVFVCDMDEINEDTLCANMDEPLGTGAGEISFGVPE